MPIQTTRPPAARPGFTLIEILLATTLGASIVALAYLAIAQAITRGGDGSAQVRGQLAVADVAERFRADASAARGAEMAGDDAAGAALRLNLSDGRQIDYAVANGRLERRLLRDGEVVEQQAFDGGVWQFSSVAIGADPRFVSLELRSAEHSTGSRGAPLRVLARLDRNASPPASSPPGVAP